MNFRSLAMNVSDILKRAYEQAAEGNCFSAMPTRSGIRQTAHADCGCTPGQPAFSLRSGREENHLEAHSMIDRGEPQPRTGARTINYPGWCHHLRRRSRPAAAAGTERDAGSG